MADIATKTVLLAVLTLVSAGGVAKDLEDTYSKSCAVCHAAGAAGAPKTGAVEDWKPRLDKGMDTLVKSVVNGLNAMPPKGMCFDCSDEDYRALIEYMSQPK